MPVRGDVGDVYNEDDEEFPDGLSSADHSPSDVVVAQEIAGRRIENPDDVLGLCSECKSEQPEFYMQNNVFAAEGRPVPCKFCNTPDAPVWMGDFSFKSMGDIKVGDEIIGIMEGGKKNQYPRVMGPNKSMIGKSEKNGNTGYKSRLVRTVVQGVSFHKAPVIRVTMESGHTIVCTADHRWYDYNKRIVADERLNSRKDPFTIPELGKDLTFIIDPNSRRIEGDAQAYAAGYVAGIYDGEGGSLRMAQSQIANPHVCAKIEENLNKLDISYTRTEGHSHNMVNYTLTGGWREYLDFLSLTNPAKRDIEEHFLTSRFRQPDKIINIEPAFGGREVDVVDLTTGTGNYVAWGYASKNCGGVCVIVYREIINESFLNRLDSNRGIDGRGTSR